MKEVHVIHIQNLTKYYGHKMAIEDVSFQVEKGEILGFLGPNAAGKTTTMRILTCFMPPTSGTATVCGFDIMEQSLEVRRRIGYLPENPPLYTDMSTKQYLEFVGKIKGIDNRRVKVKAGEVMERAGCLDVQEVLIKHLSKGYKQRVGLAQALIHNPEILILDEPTVGLDPKQIIEVRELIKSFGGTHTIILSTHILPEVSMTCQRVIIIDKGKIVASDTPDNLTKRLKGSESLFVEVEGPRKMVEAQLRKLKGVSKVAWQKELSHHVSSYIIDSALNMDIRRELTSMIVNQGWGLLELRPVGMSLEEIFLHLTMDEGEGIHA